MTKIETVQYDPVRKWFQPVLDFANADLSDPITDGESRRLSELLKAEPMTVRTRDERVFLLATHTIRWSEGGEPAKMQNKLVGLLAAFINDSEAFLLRAELSSLIGDQSSQATLWYMPERDRLEVIVGITTESLAQWYGISLVLFRQLSGIWIGRCEHEQKNGRCNRFYIGIKSKRFCSDNHASQHRKKKKRKRDAEEMRGMQERQL